MNLTPPSFVIFILSFIMVLAVLLTKYATGVEIPLVTEIVRKSMFEVTLLAYILLFAGVVFRRI